VTDARSNGGRIRRVRVQVDGAVIELEWDDTGDGAGLPQLTIAAAGPEQPADPSAVELAATSGTLFVSAPMVGTFYHAPEPNAQPFVAVGDTVEAGQRVGILEAMKLMNDVHADYSGRVVEFLVPNGAPVEFDQPLIALEPLSS
jgi:acetyl-CoA carboxylase biotin carboxyl carrier protein